ncbi:DUF5977 domain-containing protein [Chitinophaga filiformis]|uniref:PA14 domain-containing protein n=1 Tax=Chitinophaga filiformis TaxID=104663 RepID=A0A1G8CC37_CHIFI|nr:DUF5977 domain-containing protein [Chitinophaga filiformis]SDH43051.1 PA14 domain-containing protein [Chitinophaga filiformis]
MILEISEKRKRVVAYLFLTLLYFETIIPSYALGNLRTPVYATSVKKAPAGNKVALSLMPKASAVSTRGSKDVKAKAFIGGPTQPEMQQFASVNGANMVDLFTGDFSYSIPLLDVGGYPIAIGYNSGVSMDQEASWVGLGWNINPGTITRNMRGLPDDFEGTQDTVQKITSIKPNKTFGGSIGATVELVGFPLTKSASDSGGLSVQGSIGLFYNNYKGIGIESSASAGINAGSASMGTLSGSLSMTNNSQEGASIGTSIDYNLRYKYEQDKGGFGGSIAVGSTYSSRSGLKALQLSAGLQQYAYSKKNERYTPRDVVDGSANLSFAYPTYTPGISLPYTSYSFSFTAKLGSATKVLHPNWFLSAYYSTQEIKSADRSLALPAYGYLNYQKAGSNAAVLLDFNREKEMPYREKPEVPNIAMPAYTYDVFGMTGEGTGGSFRAYRGDVGYVFDHQMRTKDASGGASIDLGGGDLTHMGADLHLNRASTVSGPWIEENPLATNVAFRKSDKFFEAAYFRNPGEMTINDTAFFRNIGGDDVVAVNLYQPGISSSELRTTNILNRYKNQRFVGKQVVTPKNTLRNNRDKRTQVISYLTAEEADRGGLSKYIDNYKENSYGIDLCGIAPPDDTAHGLKGDYYSGKGFEQFLFSRIDPQIDFKNKDAFNANRPAGVAPLNESFTVRWTGRVKAPVTGTYTFYVGSDDGDRFYLNDTMVIDVWRDDHPYSMEKTTVNLVAGETYDLKLELMQGKRAAVMRLFWQYGGLPAMIIPRENLYQPAQDTFTVAGLPVSKENRINDFRKKNHISEIDVLNKDGRRYVYGIPVYNLQQKEATFAVDKSRATVAQGVVGYTPGADNTVDNQNGIDHYFSSERVPAYAHSFLLTGVLSPDYQDLKGDGITPDDPGDAIKFNYTKTAGIKNPYEWRIPAGSDSASYNEGLKTDSRDDKGNYVYGQKELWYLNSIESKNMIATFKVSKRDDLAAIDENGVRLPDQHARKLDEINLYTKADFKAHGTAARPIKTVHFDYSYELCPGANKPLNNNGKLTLKKIWFTYNGNDTTGRSNRNPYVFYYNSKNPGYSPKANDRWGNYKDPLQNPGSSAGNVLTNADYPYALQDSTLAAQNVAAWTLDSIILPSGGRMKVTYESDDYAYVQNKRAAQMYQIAGFSAGQPSKLSDLSADLYGVVDYMYVGINVPYAVSSNEEVYDRYLQNMDKLYFRLFVEMPGDKFGKGREYVPCYATLDPGQFGFINGGNTIWVRMKAIDPAAKMNTSRSVYSPLAQSAIQFLKLNLPSKAYPGSDVGDDLGPVDAIKVLMSQVDNVNNMLLTFETATRIKKWARNVDLTRSYARLNNPYYKKYGGGLRVKKVVIYDYWNKMTKQKESVYGQEYQYTTTRNVNGKKEVISSGVASYEPIIGGEENPWKVPVEYNLQVSTLTPVDRGYTELPFGEGFFPAPSVGYSKVRVRTIHADKTRSANGYEETCFYTGYDFPTLTDVSNLGDNKKRFKPLLSNLLHINARNFLALSQGFKVELNDMTGKIRSQASYPETDPDKALTYAEYFYKVDDEKALYKHLNNTVSVISPQGNIDTAATIGKDIELMMDMREQRSVTNSNNLNINADLFTFSFPPLFLIPMALNLIQREETKFRSVAATKIVSRHGILDSIIAIDKGSRVTTRNLLYDGETGDVLLTSTQNEFNDPIYNFSFPVGWAYDGMSGAYKNIGLVMNNIKMSNGRIVEGLSNDTTHYFAAGDELLIHSYQRVVGTACDPKLATFPSSAFIYAVDANAVSGGNPDIYFVDRDGVPFSGDSISLKIVRSGRRNIAAAVGSVTSLTNPLRTIAGKKVLVLDSTSNVVAASAVAYNQFWKVVDKKKPQQSNVCLTVPYSQYVGENGDGGIKYYGNQAQSRTIRKNDCGTGIQGTNVTYTVPANRYSSTISVADANAMASAEIDSVGQIYANINGSCGYSYKNRADSVTIRHTNCDSAAIPLPYTYKVAAGTFTSTISQEDADELAKQRLRDSAEISASVNGRCYYSNDTTGLLVYPVCDSGRVPTGVYYAIPANVDTSMISKAAANDKARARFALAAQMYANAYGSCGALPIYATIEHVRVSTTQTEVYEKLFITFYSEENLITEANASNLAVTYKITHVDCKYNQILSEETITEVCSGQRKIITHVGGDLIFRQDENSCDRWIYEVLPGPGYIPVNPPQEPLP